MELESLKAIWQKETKFNNTSNKKDMEQLQLILKQKTSATLESHKEKYKGIISYLLIGLLFNIIISPFLHYLLGDNGPVFRITFPGLLSLVTILITGIVVVFFYWIKFYHLKTEVFDSNLQISLQQNIALLKKSLKQEISFIISIFLFLFIAGRLSSEYLGNGNFYEIFRTDIMLALGAGLAVMLFYIFKRVTLYKKNINKLESYVAEFEKP